MKSSVVPWILVVILSAYVYGLQYHAENRAKPDPSYGFYDTTVVHVNIRGSHERHDVYGRFNNILEGQRQIIKAESHNPSNYRLVFEVNSPRPAVLYVDDEAIEIFLMPGDTSLKVSMYIAPNSYQIDSVHCTGETAGICHYFRAKYDRFQQKHLRSARNLVDPGDFSILSAKLDSMAAQELSFLAEQEVFATLPSWFVSFEKNEILYQKAYLKLSKAYNRAVPAHLLDQVPISNEGAKFSYYYYLYLNTYLNQQAKLSPGDLNASSELYRHRLAQQLEYADTLLEGGPHDVFMTRAIFDVIQRKDWEFADDLLDAYSRNFSSKIYSRFLKWKLEEQMQG